MFKKDMKVDPKEKSAPTSGRDGTGPDYRRIATATGPAATKGSHTPTGDPHAKPAEDGSPADFHAQRQGNDDEESDSK
ncbi:hypothetical protein JGS39_09250 [Streptomyces sp. P01-B04]|uniref:hypothetical protein n=1 Tax=Streptomyces poriferorum TaxID=2798799 RepID=UPI001C5FF749|nr:hypothetical protein [Streptomyces poriferorum]MBW5249195.1 hypothetical protein [Streptomyces poriferorum]MBW5258435.1 hypothetical protein [Streptomyces poriferorum]